MALMICINPRIEAVTVAIRPLNSITLLITKKSGFKCSPNAPSRKASIPSFACGFAFVTFKRPNDFFVN